MDKAAEERKKKIRNLEYSLFAGEKTNNVSNLEIFLGVRVSSQINFHILGSCRTALRKICR